MKDTLTTGEAAKYCGVNFRTVIRWIEKGYLEAYKLPGRGDNRIPIAAFVEFLNNNNMPVPEELANSAASPETETMDSNSEASDSDTAAHMAPTAGGKPKILVIEDEDLMAKSITRTLKRGGYEVTVATNGIEAGIELERYQPALITLDLQMPGMSGFEVLEALRKNDAYTHIKVLIVSAATRVKVLEVMELGVDDTLEKPFTSDELMAKVTKLLPIT